MEKQYLIPGSILLGCAMIAGALYFGLQGGTSQPGAPGAVSPSSAATAATPGLGGSSRPSPAQPTGAQALPGAAAAVLNVPAAAADVQAAAVTAAKSAVETEKKATILPRCWEPAIKSRPSPAVAKYMINMTFDPTGKEVARGIAEDRAAERADVAACLRQLPLGLQIAPPGVTVRVEVPLELP